MKFRTILLPVILLLSCIACNKKSDVPPNIFKDVFPISIGNRWIYALKDTMYYPKSSTDSSFDYTKPEVSNDKYSTTIDTLEGKTIIRHINIEGFAPMDTSFRTFGTSGDTLRWYEMANVPLVFPLTVGASWTYPREYYSRPGTIDTVKVLRIETVNTPFGRYENAYLLQEGLMGIQWPVKSYWWVVPKIGIVKHEMQTPFQHTIHEIVDFQPAK